MYQYSFQTGPLWVSIWFSYSSACCHLIICCTIFKLSLELPFGLTWVWFANLVYWATVYISFVKWWILFFKTLSWKAFDCYVHTCTKHTPSCSKEDSTVHRINLYPLGRAILFLITYTVDSAIQLLNNWGPITSVTYFTKFWLYNDQSLAQNMNGTWLLRLW